MGWQHTSTSFLLVRHLQDRIAVTIYNHNLLDFQSLDLGSGPLPVVFIFQCGQEVTPLFLGKGRKYVSLSSLLSYMDVGRTSLVVTQISYSVKLRPRTLQLDWSYMLPFFKGGVNYLSSLFISRTLFS